MAVTLHTSLGDLKLELFCEQAPHTCKVTALLYSSYSSLPTSVLLSCTLLLTSDVDSSACLLPQNFLALCAMGVYDGTLFHRNMKGFIVQGGDPTGTGKGGTAYNGGRLSDEIVDELTHSARGVVSMANRGPNTGGSQFFICYAPAPHLNGVNAVFARVIDGLDVLDAIERQPVDAKHRPVAPITLQRCTIHANPIAEEEHRRG